MDLTRLSTGRILTLLIVTTLALSLATPVMAAVTLDGSTDYQGVDGSSQAITVTVTLSPEQSKISEVDLQISSTAQTFLDEKSFSTTVSPANQNVNVTYTGNGDFSISELRTGETVKITFNVYPKTIKQKSIPAATVTVDYVQNGQQLSDKMSLSADLSNSSYFAYQNAKQGQQFGSVLDLVGLAAIAILFLITCYKIVDHFRTDDSPPGMP